MHHGQTGGVLAAVPSAAVMGAGRIFFPGGKFRDAKKLTTFLVVTLKTGLLMHKTLYNISRGKFPQNINFFEGGVFVEGGGAPVPWHSGTITSPSL